MAASVSCCSERASSEGLTVLEYPAAILQSLHQLWLKGVFCDVDIHVDGKTFAAHRIILCASCAFFRAMFESGLVEEMTAKIDIHGVDADTFKLILEFIYTGEVEINEDNCQDLLAAANMYGISDVVNPCCYFLKRNLHRENCLGIYLFADAHACLELKQDAEKFINLHFEHLAKEEEFLNLSLELLVKLLKSENLFVEDEFQVLCAGLNWLLHDPGSRRKYIFDILEHIRIPIILEKDLHNLIDNCPDIGIKVVLQKYIVDFKFDRKISMKLQQNKINPRMLKPRKSARKNIYVIGGSKQFDKWRWGDGITVPTVQRLDTYTKKWHDVTEMQYSRCGHGAAVLNGLIYVVGGENESLIIDTVECYDPTSNKWSKGPSLVSPRCGLGLCATSERLYAFGGWIGSTLGDTVEEFDPDEEEWKIISKTSTPRYAMGVMEYEGLIYVVGGLDADDTDLALVEAFNAVTREWTRLADMKMNRSYLGLAAVDGELYAFGGINRYHGDLLTVEKYSVQEDKWTEACHMSDKRSALCSNTVNGLIYLTGGQKNMDRISSYSTPVTLDTVECYDPKAKKWSKLPYMSVDRCKAAAVVM